MNNNKLLINEPPLQVLPTLARYIGLNNAIVVQQIHYWLSNPKIGKVYKGRKWIYNTVEEWQAENFPFWSMSTLRRIFSDLENKKILITTQTLNKKRYDKTKWYALDYDMLERVCIKASSQNDYSKFSNPIVKVTTPSGQNEQMEVVNMDSTIPETTQRQPENKPDVLDDIFKALERGVKGKDEKYPTDQFLIYGQAFEQIYQKLTGRYIGLVEKDKISDISGAEGADPKRWALAIREAKEYWTGNAQPSLSRYIEYYNAGGTHEKWVEWRKQQEQNTNGAAGGKAAKELTPEQIAAYKKRSEELKGA